MYSKKVIKHKYRQCFHTSRPVGTKHFNPAVSPGEKDKTDERPPALGKNCRARYVNPMTLPGDIYQHYGSTWK